VWTAAASNIFKAVSSGNSRHLRMKESEQLRVLVNVCNLRPGLQEKLTRSGATFSLNDLNALQPASLKHCHKDSWVNGAAAHFSHHQASPSALIHSHALIPSPPRTDTASLCATARARVRPLAPAAALETRKQLRRRCRRPMDRLHRFLVYSCLLHRRQTGWRWTFHNALRQTNCEPQGLCSPPDCRKGRKNVCEALSTCTEQSRRMQLITSSEQPRCRCRRSPLAGRLPHLRRRLGQRSSQKYLTSVLMLPHRPPQFCVQRLGGRCNCLLGAAWAPATREQPQCRC
jgi:hypothetical protein